MEGDRTRWDAKYEALGTPLSAPDAFVLSVLEELGPGQGKRAVDLAAGRGRHALELARRGWATEAWDVSPVGLKGCSEAARAQGLVLETRTVDLLPSGPRWPAFEPFELALVVNFLDRPLWARLAELLEPGAHVLATTYTLDYPGSKPPARFRLEPGELALGLAGLETVRSFEANGRAGILARRLHLGQAPRGQASRG